MVSHDRYFMDRMVDHLFVFEGAGVIKDFPGNYGLYQQWLKDENAKESAVSKSVSTEAVKRVTPAASAKPKLSYKEKQELEKLEKEIRDLNKEKEQLTEKLHDGTINFDMIQQLSQRFNIVEETLQTKEFRWLELSELSEA
jgi:ABC transport system ATP-binding/permease protein